MAWRLSLRWFSLKIGINSLIEPAWSVSSLLPRGVRVSGMGVLGAGNGIHAQKEFFQPGAVRVGISAFQNPPWALQEIAFLSLLSQTFHLTAAGSEHQTPPQAPGEGKSTLRELLQGNLFLVRL